ncbi:RING finger domain-containing protein [Francisella frigiditurris]|uniref:Zinc finger, C3HC4 type family protein n=1 Tax=Francisella frigiditurris TaxID=1542390 RepID=A0A1J0KUB4_9GAMM|nr:RING finger domain-containing protein [Francisella frigiditurris]APC97238.1 zinc finger, C3HC4 type family protein [Francisella frigiditurris]
MECPICQTEIDNKTDLSCKHSFCNSCIREWSKNCKTCPICRKIFSASEIIKIDPEELKKAIIESCTAYIVHSSQNSGFSFFGYHGSRGIKKVSRLMELLKNDASSDLFTIKEFLGRFFRNQIRDTNGHLIGGSINRNKDSYISFLLNSLARREYLIILFDRKNFTDSSGEKASDITIKYHNFRDDPELDHESDYREIREYLSRDLCIIEMQAW